MYPGVGRVVRSKVFLVGENWSGLNTQGTNEEPKQGEERAKEGN